MTQFALINAHTHTPDFLSVLLKLNALHLLLLSPSLSLLAPSPVFSEAKPPAVRFQHPNKPHGDEPGEGVAPVPSRPRGTSFNAVSIFFFFIADAADVSIFHRVHQRKIHTFAFVFLPRTSSSLHRCADEWIFWHDWRWFRWLSLLFLTTPLPSRSEQGTSSTCVVTGSEARRWCLFGNNDPTQFPHTFCDGSGLVAYCSIVLRQE